ncbi:MAG: maleylpyruvate isomerase family mycothiol-dependent enzyme [Rhodococcus sp.]|nr:maleylpyruvate isomerase family mycothiol-dependent enzyme [Rhodococcus sp. (in: high G+C Gram-positive bacteria)]
MTTPTAPDPLVIDTFAQRRYLAEILESLTAQQWSHPSLCSGWRVREVVAHITLPYRHSIPRILAGIVAARGRFNVFSDRIARRDTRELTDSELLECLAHNIEHRWRPPGGGQVGALSHDVIHGLDITEALALPGPPAERIHTVLAHTEPDQLGYFGVDLSGVRLQATDCDFSIGEGKTVQLPAKDILLIVTGRRSVPMREPEGA